MVDPVDSRAYLAYDAWGNDHAILIERLTEDYTDSMGVQGRYSVQFVISGLYTFRHILITSLTLSQLLQGDGAKW